MKLIWNLCLFRSSPEEIPYSIPLLLSILFLNFSAIFFMVSVASSSWLLGASKAVLVEALVATFTFIILYKYGYLERFVQAFSGLLATKTLIMVLIAIPYILMATYLLPSGYKFFDGLCMMISGLLVVVGSLWLFVVYTRIFQRALEVSINYGLLITLMLFALITMVMKCMKGFI